MAKIIALKSHRYGGAAKKPGDRYEINSSSAEKLYRALGWVGDAPPESPAALVEAPPIHAPVASTYHTQAVDVEQPVGEEVQPASAATAKRAYRRRDLRAE